MNDALRQLITHELRIGEQARPWPIMEGWCTPERGLELAEVVLEHKPEVVVEIGVFGGRSLIAQALALRDNGFGKIYGIDPWKTSDAIEAEQDEAGKKWWEGCDLGKIHDKAMKAIWDLKLDEWVVIIQSASQHVAQLFPRIDMLFIDGNHSEAASCRDVQLYLPRVRVGGVIEWDDADWGSTQKALGMLNLECQLTKDRGHTRQYRKI